MLKRKMKSNIVTATQITQAKARKIFRLRVPKLANKFKPRLKSYLARLFKRKKLKLTPAETKVLAKKIQDKLSKVELRKLDIEAKILYQEILKGKSLGSIDDKLLSAIKRYINKEYLKLARAEKIAKIKAGQVKGKMPKTAKIMTKAQRRAFARDLDKSYVQFDKVQAEVVRIYKTPSGIRAFTQNGRLKVIRYGFEGRGISNSRLGKIRFAINKKVAKVVEKRLLSGKEVRQIPRLSLIHI